MIIRPNPDTEYFKKKKKMIKKNNGFCLGMPKTEDWKCPCKSFREKQESGFCGEALYYKDMEAEEEENEMA